MSNCQLFCGHFDLCKIIAGAGDGVMTDSQTLLKNDELMHFLILTYLYHERLGDVTLKLLGGMEAGIDAPLSQRLDELNSQGCWRAVLLYLVALVGAFRKLPSNFKVMTLRKLARD